MLQQLNVVDDSCKSTLLLKRKADIVSISYMTFQFINNTVIFLSRYVTCVIIINYQSLNYAVK